MRTAQPDVILWLAPGMSPYAELEGVPRCGIVTVGLGRNDSSLLFWTEVATSSPTTATSLFWFESSVRRARLIRQAETATWQGIAFTRNAPGSLAAAARMLGWFCVQLATKGPSVLDSLRRLPETPVEQNIRPEYPSNWSAGRFLASKLLRSASKRLQSGGRKTIWFVAIRPNRGGSPEELGKATDRSGFTELPLYPDSEQMADPFLWQHGGKDYLFFEDIPAATQRGRIGCSQLQPDGSPGETRIILETPLHISYPCIVPVGRELFLMPESADAGRVELYRFRSFPWELELAAAPVDGFAFVDTTPILLDGVWYIFTTTPEPFMETVLFVADRLEGPWRLHPASPISGSVTNSRSAGHLYFRNGRLFRPTQDCSIRYGYAMTVNEIIRLTPSEFEERRAFYVPPAWKQGLLGTHTWNESAAFQVIDGLRLQ